MDSVCFMCVSQQQASFSHSVVTFFVEETNVFLIKYDKWLVCSTIFFCIVLIYWFQDFVLFPSVYNHNGN